MFLPAAHAETEEAVLLQFIRENPLGMLITGIQSSAQDFLQVTHVPWVVDFPGEVEAAEGAAAAGEAPQGLLRAHIAKQNPQVKSVIGTLGLAEDAPKPDRVDLDDEVLVVFNGKHDHYVTPKFYTETKPDSGRVVPTWNYAAAQVYGKLSLFYDSQAPQTAAFLARQTRDLSLNSERGIMGYTGGERPQPWKVEDAPDKYVELLQRNIVGIQIRISKVQGKFKMSQEMRPGDREGVVKGFARLGGETGNAISAMVHEKGVQADEKKKKKDKA